MLSFVSLRRTIAASRDIMKTATFLWAPYVVGGSFRILTETSAQYHSAKERPQTARRELSGRRPIVSDTLVKASRGLSRSWLTRCGRSFPTIVRMFHGYGNLYLVPSR